MPVHGCYAESKQHQEDGGARILLLAPCIVELPIMRLYLLVTEVKN